MLLFVFASFLLTSCGGDEPDNPGGEDIPGSSTGPGGSQPGTSDPDFTLLISQNVSVKATYSNFLWNFEIQSTLHNVLPGRKIQFGIGHGDVNGTTSISVENKAYFYSSRTSGDTFICNFKNPFWFYYVAGMETTDHDAWGKCEMYYTAYVNLTNQGLGTLNNSEKVLYNQLVQYLKEYEDGAKGCYKPSVYVYIDDKGHKVAQYRQ